MTDWTVLPISKCRDQFQGVSRLALGSQSALEFAADKFKTISLARKLGIPVPETVLIQSVDDLHSTVAHFDFPVVIKPRFSARWKGNRAILGSVSYAYSLDDPNKK